MATAIEKFREAKNKDSLYWVKGPKHNLSVVTQNGKIQVVHCDGFTYISDPEKK